MNILNIDIKDSLPYIIDAFSEVYGEEYRDVITDRIYNKTYFFMYNNVEGIQSYLLFLKLCKERELSIKFLNEIGIDVSKYKDISYAQDFDESLTNLINSYIGSYRGMTPYSRRYRSRIRAWIPFDEEIDQESEKAIEQEKIDVINFLRHKTPEQTITRESFKAFCKTNEYKQIEKEIKQYLAVFDQISKEYDEFLKELQPYQNYVDEENARKIKLRDQKRKQLYCQIEGLLTDEQQSYLDSKYSTIDEKSKALFGDDLGIKSYMEHFSSADENKLLDPSISDDEKDRIYRNRNSYFEKLGAVQVSIDNIFNPRKLYAENIQQDSVKRLILPTEVADKIKELRTKAYEELQRDFIWSSNEFLEIVKIFGDNQYGKEEVFENIKEKKVCISPVSTNNGESIHRLFFTIIEFAEGILDYLFLHELNHSIETKHIYGSLYMSGFDRTDSQKNPYNGKNRKYERMNETINDIFAIQAREILHQKGIYVLEPKEHIIADVKDRNTHSIVKNLLSTFMERYRDLIVRARITYDTRSLYEVIGQENFEELNDVVNKVDSLIWSGLPNKLKDGIREDPIVQDYYKQLERLAHIYDDMEKHQLKVNQGDQLVSGAINITKKSTRWGQLEEGASIIGAVVNSQDKNKPENLKDLS